MIRQEEVEAAIRNISSIRPNGTDSPYRCPLCPWRSFLKRDRVRGHIRTYHDGPRQYTCSGTKQLKIISALWDHDALLRILPTPSYLQRSASILRESVSPGVCGAQNEIDRDIRLVLSRDGPQYRHINRITHAAGALRRVRNLHYDKDFAEILRTEVLLHGARVRSLRPRLLLRAAEAGSLIAGLYPSKVARWWPIIEDIFSSPAAEVLTANLIRELADYEELESLSVDATMRVTMSIMGQSHIRDRQTGDAFHRQDCMRRLITVIGRTGAVIAMQPTERENTDTYRDVLSACIPGSALGHVRFIATDDPSPVMWRELSQLLPSLEVMCLDCTHLPIVYEYSTWNRRTTGSRTLRCIMSKFTAYDPNLPANTWGQPYTGHENRPLNREEQIIRRQIESKSMSKVRAQRLIDQLDVSRPFVSRVEFIESLAALVALFPEETSRVAKGANKAVHMILHCATAEDRIEWYLNNVRFFPVYTLSVLICDHITSRLII